ncbi:MAG: alpha-amylase family glycosyl hydrolase [Anaerolineales bacterium]|jgi:glycosidase|nr:alpha-amylase family glycosyl hydrolase [Anaerolineales bacterium]
MAANTPPSDRNLVIYEVYLRNHGPNGTFADIEADLERIHSLGVDVVWFMPIHPIGRLNKKGGLGCPYSIQDYRAINPEYGSREDFARFIEKAHGLGLKVMIDVVYNHTAHDSVLVAEHPDYFHQDAHGRPVTTVPEWSDVIDLRHPNPGLSEYLIETLSGWAKFGVDGFRCDVASLLPQEFWLQARAAVEQVKPGVIWLAESVHASFITHRRENGLSALSDGELYAAFDLTYDYDIWPIFQQAVRGVVPVKRYLEALRFQDAIYPRNFVKMRCVENHDQVRILKLAATRSQALAWTAFEAFNRGAFLIYAGQESAATHTPSLFDIDKIDWGNYELQSFLTRLAGLKKHPALEGNLHFLAAEPAIQAAWVGMGKGLYGVFNASGQYGRVEVQLPDGDYLDLLTDMRLSVRGGSLELPIDAAILEIEHPRGYQPMSFELMDYHLPAE